MPDAVKRNLIDTLTSPSDAPPGSREALADTPEDTRGLSGDVTPGGGMVTLPADEPPIEPGPDEPGTEQNPGEPL